MALTYIAGTSLTSIKGASPSDDEEGTAYHETRHAIVGALRDRASCWVTIIAADGAFGKTEFPNDVRPEYRRTLNDSLSKPAFRSWLPDNRARLTLSGACSR